MQWVFKVQKYPNNDLSITDSRQESQLDVSKAFRCKSGATRFYPSWFDGARPCALIDNIFRVGSSSCRLFERTTDKCKQKRSNIGVFGRTKTEKPILFETITYCHYELHWRWTPTSLLHLGKELYEAGSGTGDCKRFWCKFEPSQKNLPEQRRRTKRNAIRKKLSFEFSEHHRRELRAWKSSKLQASLHDP